MYCTNHPEEEAFGICIYCGKAFCYKCLTRIKGEFFCKADVKVVEERKSKSSKSRKSGCLMPTKNRSIAAILAFFLGWIGVHKFYLDQKGAGILYLLFCWTGIPLIVSIADGIGYLLCSDHIFACKYGGQVI